MSKSKDTSSMFSALQGLKQETKPEIKETKPVVSKEEKIKKLVEDNAAKKEEPKKVKEEKKEEAVEKPSVTKEVNEPKAASKAPEAASGKKMPTSIRMDADTKEKLLTIALKKSVEERKMISISDILDEAINDYIKKNKNLL